MAKFKVNYSGVADANRILKKALRELEALDSQTESLKGRIDPNIQKRYNIRRRLNATCIQASDTVSTTKKLLKLTSTGAVTGKQMHCLQKKSPKTLHSRLLQRGALHPAIQFQYPWSTSLPVATMFTTVSHVTKHLQQKIRYSVIYPPQYRLSGIGGDYHEIHL